MSRNGQSAAGAAHAICELEAAALASARRTVLTTVVTTVLAAALTAFALTPQARAASFTLSDGLRLEGQVSAAGRRYVTIDTRAGSRLVPRNALVEVALPQSDGGVVKGRLQAWRDGDYTLSTPGGVVVARDNGGGAAPVAGAPVKPEPSAVRAERRPQPTTPRPAPTRPAETQPATTRPAPVETVELDRPVTVSDPSPAEPAEKPTTAVAPAAPETAPSSTSATATDSAAATENQTSPDTPTRARRSSRVDARPRDSFGELAQVDSVRGLLDGIIVGRSAEEPAATETPPDAEPPAVDAPEAAREAPALPPSASAANVAAAELAGDAAAERRRRRAPRLPPAGPLREVRFDFRDGVNGGYPARDRGRSCARLTTWTASPTITPPSDAALAADPTLERRKDPRTLSVGMGGDYASETFVSLAQSYFNLAGLDAVASPVPSELEPLAASVEAAQERVSMPARVTASRFPDADAALASVKQGVSDLILSPPPAVNDPSVRRELVAFDALAIVVAPSSPIRSLTARDIASLLSGAVSDWSMIETALMGAPTLYLPAPNSAELSYLADLVDVRRIRPVSARYLPDPRARIEAALADPHGLAIVSRSALGDTAPLPIGRPDAGVAPTLDTIRTASYPLTIPVYVSTPYEPTHPSAPTFSVYLGTPEGQRAVYNAGLFPVAACDPSTCSLKTPGLKSASDTASSPRVMPPLSVAGGADIRLTSGRSPYARFPLPASLETPPPAMVDQVAQAIDQMYAGPEADRPLLVVARAGLPGAEAGAERVRIASARAEAATLALRCAGLNVARFGVDPVSTGGGGAAPTGEISIEVLDAQPR